MKTTRVKTFSKRKEDVIRQWRLIDAQGQVLGELATQLATILIGKDKSDYTPHLDQGDYIVLINASQIVVTGKKSADKLYYRHSNYPGGMKHETFATLIKRNPEAIIKTAVKGMLPANRLRDARLARLKVFADHNHTYANFIK